MNPDLGEEYDANEFHATYEIIEALEVSSESRTLALKYYKFCFGNELRHPIYFNSDKDILKFTKLALGKIAYFSTRDVWNTGSWRAANVKRVAVEMQNDVNFFVHPNERTLLVHATLLFGILETIFVQPSFVIGPSSEAAFRAKFEKQVELYLDDLGLPSDGELHNVPEIVISQLDEYVQHTEAVITKTAAANSEPACFPTMQNLVVTLFLDIGNPGPEPYLVWLNRLRKELDFNKFILKNILRELLESVSKVQSLKKIYLLTEEEQMPGPGPVQRIDGRLMDLFAEDNQLQSRYGEGLRMPEVVCLTIMEFPEELARVIHRYGRP
ncbi:hypothetical protein BCON_0355g00050 [Botryotinia convoluta]|uniref:2EXR domain-containing protein n=1 Tax=Botryotinia convoluta TaxID=54673 RepID=A0A4Z1HA54_9HELO|nr:hypothetical protein BCON_0355g00050 [Botryotinia convoluta]